MFIEWLNDKPNAFQSKRANSVVKIIMREHFWFKISQGEG